RAYRCGRQRAVHRLHQLQSRRGAAIRAAARGPVLPAARGPDPGAAVARSARRHPPVGQSLPGVLLAAPPRGRRTAAQAGGRGGRGAALPPVEGQCARGAERDRAYGCAAAPEGGTGYAAPSVEPLAGVSSPIITAAARRVAQRIRDDRIDAADMDIVAAVLAAIALAVDQQRPRYVTELVHRASPALGARLLE